jgi:uncharacterized protein (TIGR00369 family)
MRPQNPNYRAAVEGIVSGAPFIKYLGIKLDDLGPGWCQTALPIKEFHLQQDGFIHAGVLATLADHSAGMASLTLVPQNQIVLTVEFKINILRPAKGERLSCKAKVLKYGKTITVTESEIFMRNSAEEKLVAKATITIANVDQTT